MEMGAAGCVQSVGHWLQTLPVLSVLVRRPGMDYLRIDRGGLFGGNFNLFFAENQVEFLHFAV